MAREYIERGEPDQHGMRDMTVKQRIGNVDGKIVYRTTGDGADAPGLWIDWIHKVVRNMPEAEKAAQYERWVYGVDLYARQQGKQGGPADPWVPMSKIEEMHLIDGTVRSRETEEVIPGRTRDLADRVRYINRAVEFAMERGENPAKAVISGRDGLVAAGQAKMDGGRLVVVEGAPAPAPSQPAAKPAPARRSGSAK